VYKRQENSHSRSIKVLGDPRTDWGKTGVEEKDSFIQDVNDLVNGITHAVDRLDAAKKTIGKVMDLAAEDDEAKKKSREISSQITELREKIIEKQVQGFRNDPNAIINQLGNLRGKMEGSYKPVTQPQRFAYEKVKGNAGQVLAEIDQFFAEDWAAYKAYVDALNLELVPEFK